MSDVERQIEQWRNELRTSDAFGAADIDELEGHLREEMQRLRPLGLSETESFLVAHHRLGAAAALEAEYEKVNTDRRPLLRFSWMAAGVLVYVLAGYLAVGVSHAGMVAALPLRVGPAALAWIGIGTEAVAAAVLLLLAWACVRRCSWNWLTGRLRTTCAPWLVLLLGGLVVAVCLLFGFELLFRMAAVRCVNAEEYSQMVLIRSYASLGWAILAPLLAGILVVVLRTRANRSRPTLS